MIGTMGGPLKILVIEDDADFAAGLVDFLAARGHLVDAAGDGVTGLHLAITQRFDVILLDLTLPGMDGITLCRRLRTEAENITPVLMLGARDSLEDKIAGLEAGADDYLVKPFALPEMAARVHALARRASISLSLGELQVADLSLDPATFEVSRAGVPIELAPIPLRLLETLMRASPRVVLREELERATWGDAPPDSDALRAHMHILRSAVDKPFGQPLIRTLRGIGWQIVAPNAEGESQTP